MDCNCQDFIDAIKTKLIKKELIKKKLYGYFIRGCPRLVNDGDGYYDDMTESTEINFCPFCGGKLLKG